VAAKKAVVATTTTSGTTVTSKEAITATTTATTVEKSVDGKGATRKAGTREGRVIRGATASVERSLLEESEEEWNVLPVEEDSKKKLEEEANVKRVMGNGRTTRQRGKLEVEVQIESKEKEKKRSGRGRREVQVGAEVEDSRKVEVEVGGAPAKGRVGRSGRGKKVEESVDAHTNLTPKTPVREVVESEEVVEEEKAEVAPAQKKKPGRPAKPKPPVRKPGAVKADKGKGRATDAEDEVHEELSEVPSSPPSIPTADLIPEHDDLSSTSSIYGDENFLPPPIASSTPKAGVGGTTTTLPVTPPKPLFRSSEGYTPPPPTHLRNGGAAGSSAAAGPSMGGNLSPIRRRLWDSSPAPSSPHPLSQCETPKTATMVDEGPLGFDIYEDGNQKSPSTTSVSADPPSRLMDIDRDARGDGAEANILRTPKKMIAGLETRKRTSTGTKKSPDGKIIEEDEGEAEDGDSSDDDGSDGSSSDEATPKAKPALAVVEVEPKRQKRVPEKEEKPILTRDLLDLAPRRRRTARGPARSTRSREPVVDDLGEDLTSELEDEVLVVTKKRAIAAAKRGGRATAAKEKGTTVTKKAPLPSAKKTAKGKNIVAMETPKKARGRRNSVSISKSGGVKTYGRPKGVGGGGGSDGSATPVPADKENDATMGGVGVEPSSEFTGEDSIGVAKEGRRKLKQIKKVFREVDMWEMEFEDVQASSET